MEPESKAALIKHWWGECYVLFYIYYLCSGRSKATEVPTFSVAQDCPGDDSTNCWPIITSGRWTFLNCVWAKLVLPHSLPGQHVVTTAYLVASVVSKIIVSRWVVPLLSSSSNTSEVNISPGNTCSWIIFLLVQKYSNQGVSCRNVGQCHVQSFLVDQKCW